MTDPTTPRTPRCRTPAPTPVSAPAHTPAPEPPVPAPATRPEVTYLPPPSGPNWGLVVLGVFFVLVAAGSRPTS